MIVVMRSVRGAPGATTASWVVASHWRAATGRTALLLEADPDGGALAVRLSLPVRPGLTELAASARLSLDEPDALWRCAQRAEGAHPARGEHRGTPVVVASPAAEPVAAALRAAASPLAHALLGLADLDVIVDVGRLRPSTPAAPLVEAAQRRVVVVRPDLDGIVSLVQRRGLLEGWGTWSVLVAGAGAYDRSEIRRATGLPIAGGLGEPARWWGRLNRRSRATAERLVSGLAEDGAVDLVVSGEGGS